MNRLKTMIIMAVGLGIGFAGCTVSDPGSALPNQPPTTILSSAPNEGSTVNHYIPLRWAGNDPDGMVVEFRLYIDDVLAAVTTRRDTIIAFPAPTDGTPMPHTFAVQSVDNEGLVDPTPAGRAFQTLNFAPHASFAQPGTIGAGALVGTGFRVTIAAADSNPSLTYYAIKLDDGAWSPWYETGVFLYAAPAVIADTTTFPTDVIGVANTGLAAGPHTIYARVKDAGDAESAIISRSFVVQTDSLPQMSATVAAVYGANSFYPDGSVYYRQQTGLETAINFTASASHYSGEINAYRIRQVGGEWGAWQTDPVMKAVNLSPGEYVYEFQARDLAGLLSNTASFTVRIIQPMLSDSVIVVDETRNGNGNPGSPTDEQVDLFYSNVLAGTKYRMIDYTDKPFVSPYDLQYAGLIVWHGDDRAEIKLNDNLPILRDFMNKGGRLLLSGWDVMAGFGVGSGDSTSYATGSFAREKLRCFKALRNTGRTTTGFAGAGGIPGCSIDPAKVPTSWNGMLDRCWVFQQRGECTVTGTLNVSDGATNPLANRTTAYLYDLSFRVAVFGMPLYFCVESEVAAMMTALLPRLLEGLEPVN